MPGTHARVKSPLPLLQRLTKSRHLLNFRAKLRFAVQKERVLIRLRKMLPLLATLLLAVFAVGAGASTAAAHGNHVHQVSINSSTFSAPATEARQWSRGHALAASVDNQNELPDRHGKTDCCCGSVMCHSGVTLTVDPFPFLCLTGARLIPEPASGQPQSDSSGLERPPRSRDIA